MLERKITATKPIDAKMNSFLYYKSKQQSINNEMSSVEGKGSKIEASTSGDNTTLDMTMNTNFKSKLNSSKETAESIPISRNAIQVHAKTDYSGNFRLTHLLNRGCPRIVVAAGKEDLI